MRNFCSVIRYTGVYAKGLRNIKCKLSQSVNEMFQTYYSYFSKGPTRVASLDSLAHVQA